MRHILGILSLLFTLFSCNTNKGQLNTKIEESELTEVQLTPATYWMDKYDFFNAVVINEQQKDTLQFCECSRLHNKISIKIHNGGGMYYDELLIELSENSFISTFKHFGDVKTMHFNAYPVKQTLKLNKLNAKPGDSLTGEIEFTGLAIDAFSRIPVNSININGKFTCDIKEEKY